MAIKVANNNSLSAITALPAAITSGAMTLLSTTTASSSATVDITSGIDDTYKEYIIKFYDVHPATDATHLSFQGNAAGGSGYNETITSTVFRTWHNEADTSTGLGYVTSLDQAQGTSFQIIAEEVGNDNDQSCSGYLHLFNPSSTTYVKHFIAKITNAQQEDRTYTFFTAGYFNTTSAIDEIQFKMNSGNIDAGVIKMYGVA